MNADIEPRTTRTCSHVERGALKRFAAVSLVTCETNEEGTYRFDDRLELCAYCTGVVRATLASTLGIGADWAFHVGKRG